MPLPAIAPAVGAALVSGGFSTINGILGNIFAKKANQTQFDQTVKLWNMNNEYNKPINQISRLKEAGLNPNLMYNNSSSAVGNATAPAAPAAPNYQSPLNRVAEELGTITQLKLQQKELEGKNLDNEQKAASIQSSLIQNDLMRQEYEQKNAMNPLLLTEQNQRNAALMRDIKAKDIANEVAQKTMQLKIYGINEENKAKAYDVLKAMNETTLQLMDVRVKKQQIKTEIAKRKRMAAQNALDYSQIGVNIELQKLKAAETTLTYSENRLRRAQIGYAEKVLPSKANKDKFIANLDRNVAQEANRRGYILGGLATDFYQGREELGQAKAKRLMDQYNYGRREWDRTYESIEKLGSGIGSVIGARNGAAANLINGRNAETNFFNAKTRRMEYQLNYQKYFEKKYGGY